LEGALKIIWFQPPCLEQGHLPLDQAAQSSIQPGLEHCQGGGSHSFSGQPVPVFHHPHGEEFQYARPFSLSQPVICKPNRTVIEKFPLASNMFITEAKAVT